MPSLPIVLRGKGFVHLMRESPPTWVPVRRLVGVPLGLPSTDSYLLALKNVVSRCGCQSLALWDRNKAVMDITIVIVSYNTKEMLRDCLLSLPEATSGITTEVFVVDNNSPDNSADMVAEEFPDVILIRNKENVGFAKANNQALARAKGKDVLLLNPDTEADANSLTLLKRYLDDTPNVGAVGPKLLNTDRSLQPNGSRFPHPLRDFLVISELRAISRQSFERYSRMRDDFDTICDVEAISGACMLVRGEVMQKVGMLDDAFFMFYEEVEWCWRIRKAGYRVVYYPEAQVVHHWMGSVRQNSKMMTERFFESSDLYYRKTGSPLSQFANRLVMAYGLAKNNFIHFGVRVKRRLRKLLNRPNST